METYSKIHEFLKDAPYITEEHLRTVAGSYLQHPGKALRPRLMALCCEAAGGNPDAALAAGAAVEMFHTWSLMHDDIIDHDSLRRGHPTAHVAGARLGKKDLLLADDSATDYGQALAILGGDLLLAHAIGRMTEASPVLGLRMCRKLAPELLSGEQLDIRISYLPWEQLTEEQVWKMMRGKTGALFAFAAECGVSIAQGISPDESPLARTLAAFASGCGLAFQLADDLLGIFGEEKTFGKPIGSDIREGKRTLLMLRTWNAASTEDRRRLGTILGNSHTTEAEIAWVRNLVESGGIRAEIETLAENTLSEAIDSMENALPPSPPRQQLRLWAESLVKRVK